jgi:peptidoglycan/LPS O-acetylase OafA/YrhL
VKSSSGAHYVALDHIRAVAALLVFVWHFIHGPKGYPVPFEGAPVWGPLVLFDEGHVGVALFMTLSGYLFAKLLDGKKVIYRLFLWNRVLRLFPLLLLVMAINAALLAVDQQHKLGTIYWYFKWMSSGFLLPIWPNGGWSITVELHFYLLLPLLLFFRQRFSLGLMVLLAICLRAYFYGRDGEVQGLAYWTIVGRFDQFVFGIMAFHARRHFTRRHVLVAAISVLFLTVYYLFDLAGGFYFLGGTPSTSPLWIVLCTVEGFAFASLIAWYDTSFRTRGGRISALVGKFGEYSYSIYLLHFFVVFAVADWIHRNIVDLSSFYVALPVALIAFVAMLPFGYVSMRLVEAPFLRLRKPYYRV